MYKVLIAEDEVLTRAGIAAAVDWENLDMQIAAQAADGDQALNLFRIHRPDIVITDLNMPRLDGIKLVETIVKEKPECKVIVVTCLNDVQTVRELLPFHISDYMLKSVLTVQDLTNRLLAVKKDLDESGRIGGEYIREKSEEELFGEYFNGKQAGVPYSGKLNRYVLMFPLHTRASSKALADRTVKDILTDYFEACSGLIIVSDSELHFVVCFKNPDLDKETLLHRIAQFREYIAKVLNIALLCDVELCEDLPAIRDRQREYFAWIDHAGLNEGGLLEGQTAVLRERIERIIHLYSFNTYNRQVRNLLEKMIAQPLKELLLEPAAEFSEYRRRATEGFREFARVLSLFPGQELESHAEAMIRENTFSGVYLAFMRAVDFKIDMLVYPVRENEDIERVLDYMKAHYGEKLTLKMAAEYVSLSQNYLSALFKRSMGISFIGYLINLRIFHAIRLLESPSSYLYEIAEKVGIPDMPHFSRTFKSVTGFSPNEWKKYILNHQPSAEK